MKKILEILFSYKLTLVLFFLLGFGAAVATFIENDYGTSTARILVYNHPWYALVMLLSIVNLLGIIYKVKMWRNKAKFIFHISFVVMLIGASMTRYMGFEGLIHIREGQSENRMISFEPHLQVTIKYDGKTYYQEYQFDLSALGNDFEYTINFADKNVKLKYDDYTYAKKGQSDMGILKLIATVDDESKEYKLVGKRGMKGFGKTNQFGNTNIFIEYGSKTITLPFYLKLNDFQLDRYPGSMSPSSYASEVTLMDKSINKEFDYRIFMNNTLKYDNYQFFQSSYDKDEKGTILSVNNDPGKWPTYLGYFLLTLGLIMNMFDKKSRFLKLINYIKNTSSVFIIFILTASVFTNGHSAMPLDTRETIQSYLSSFKDDSELTAKKFGYLITQSNMGRMKPVNSLNTEIINKLSRKSSLYGLNADQIVLGMMSRPEIWRDIKLIKISTPKLKKILGVEASRSLISFGEVFENNQYKLKEYVEEANSMMPNHRGTFQKDIIKVDERLNIAYMVFNANIFNLFPKEGTNSTKWYTPLDAINQFTGKNKEVVETMIRGFVSSVINKNYSEANNHLTHIAQYQRAVGASVVPKEDIIEKEIFFNNLNIFSKLTIAYIILGIILLIVSFIYVFNKNLQSKKLDTFFVSITVVLFLIHTFGMALRWYISGHAPWSDTYESLVYIAWSAMFAGVVFFRKSLLALSATVVMAGIFMFTAHLTGIDPQITNLVPVLKSYWLTIHVSIITGSYGFLGIGAILGFMTLILFIFRSEKRKNIDATIYHITAINEAALIFGLAMLIVGNFLGGVWANESWGRYWGWDPKETWAWVSIIVYAFVTHTRFIKKLDSPYIFSTLSLLAFSSILMTYFGVNFYLSGMHSYATGDPVPVPTWVYVLTLIVFVVIALGFRKKDLKRLKV